MKYLSIVLMAIMLVISLEGMAKKKTMYVNHQYVQCTGVAPQNCLQVKYNESDNWQYLYQPIEGFKFEPGNNYELVVNEKKLCKKKVPADGSRTKIKLVKIKSQTPVMSVALPKTSLNNSWTIESINVNGELQNVLSKGFTLKIDENNQSYSARICNIINGGFENNLGNSLKFKGGISTQMYCTESMAFEDAFNKALDIADNFEVNESGKIVVKSVDKPLFVLSNLPEVSAEADVHINFKGEWLFNQLLTPNTATDLSRFESKVTLGGNGDKVFGKAVCNRFFGVLALDENAKSISFGNVGSTLMLCPGDDAAIEAQLFKVMQGIKFYQVKNGNLWLLDGDGNKIELIKQ